MKFFIILILCLTFSGCNFNLKNSNSYREYQSENISFVTWNTQTFFDGVTDGCEYTDFQKSKNWDKDKYIKRLKRLCSVFETLDADIFALQEIENKAVIQDISNMMAKNSWNRKKQWPYAGFVKEENGATGCGIFSKYPISELKSHNLDIRTESFSQPPLRAIMEVSVNVNGKNLVIFINHWKSKSGGTEETEIWRDWQESVLCECINKTLQNGEKYCIAAGDFNRDIDEFRKTDTKENYSHIFLISRLPGYKSIEVLSPWLSADKFYTDETKKISTENGSYFYKDKWERIDHIFAAGDITISDFSPQSEGPWSNESGIPLRYQYYTGQGYSDHLPLKCNLTF